MEKPLLAGYGHYLVKKKSVIKGKIWEKFVFQVRLIFLCAEMDRVVEGEHGNFVVPTVQSKAWVLILSLCNDNLFFMFAAFLSRQLKSASPR